MRHHSKFAVVAILVAFLGACATAPFDYPKEQSVAIADTTDMTIAHEVRGWTAAHGGLSCWTRGSGRDPRFDLGSAPARCILIEDYGRILDECNRDD